MSSSKEELIRLLESEREMHTKFLQSLIRVPSANPPGDTKRAVKVVYQYLSELGIECEIIAPKADASNLVAVLQAGKSGEESRTLVLNGHIDHFPVSDRSEWKRDPYSGDTKDGFIHGRGGVDMKAGTAASIIAFAYMHRFRSNLLDRCILEVVSDEETGGKYGTRYLLEQYERKEVRDSLRGEGMDQELQDYLQRPDVRGVADKIMGAGAADNMLKPTVNIGTISGGVKVNMIPSSCVFEADIRLPIGLKTETVLTKIDDILADIPEASYNVQQAATNPAAASSIHHELIDLIQRNAEAVRVTKPLPICSMGATDCKHFRYHDVPVYTFGISPATMAESDEWGQRAGVSGNGKGAHAGRLGLSDLI